LCPGGARRPDGIREPSWHPRALALLQRKLLRCVERPGSRSHAPDSGLGAAMAPHAPVDTDLPPLPTIADMPPSSSGSWRWMDPT
ncbi:MAG TPA: hypothetical protein VF493_17245, partial [Terriglobales bacterium]